MLRLGEGVRDGASVRVFASDGAVGNRVVVGVEVLRNTSDGVRVIVRACVGDKAVEGGALVSGANKSIVYRKDDDEIMFLCFASFFVS